MATSGEGPSSNQINNDRLKASLRRTEQRIATARSRRARQKWLIIGCITLVVVLLLLIWGAVRVRQNAPPAPLLIVTWPKPKLQQKLVSGNTLLVRPGQPFTVTVENAQEWTPQWHSANVVNSGSTMTWSPQIDSSLKVYCHPTASGWRRLISWLWPTQQVSLYGKIASASGFHYEVKPPNGGLWIFPLIAADMPVHWDERALPLLMRADWLIPDKLSPRASQPLWTIVPAFEGKGLAGDTGTYARLWSRQPENDLPRLCREIARKVPLASIKYVIRMTNAKGQLHEGILRLAFDGKAERGGWVKRPNQTTSTLIEWWSDEPMPDQLAPSPPNRRRR